MKRIGCLLLLCLAGAAALEAQLTNTISQVLLTNSTSTGATPPVRNIGQTSHEAILSITDVGSPGTCLSMETTEPVMYFQASFDGSTWFQLGPTFSSLTPRNGSGIPGPASNRLDAQGAFPFVRFNVAALDGTHCKLTVDYVGTFSAGGTSQANVATYAGMQYATFNQGCTTTTPAPIRLSLVGDPSVSGGLVVFGALITNSAAATLQLWSYSDNGPIMPLAEYWGWVTSGPDRLLIPNTGAPEFLINIGNNQGLFVTCSANTEISGYIAYRLEGIP